MRPGARATVWAALAATLLAGGCDGAQKQPVGKDAGTAQFSSSAIQPADLEAESTEAVPPLTVEQFPALSSRDCAEVAAFYVQAIASGDFGRAALVWNDSAVDAAELKRRFAAYSRPEFALKQPNVEGAAGSLYCTVPGNLIDTNGRGPALEGELLLRRVNDVDGATAQQLRWTIRSATLPPIGTMP